MSWNRESIGSGLPEAVQMIRREQEIRTQVLRLLDGGLFAFAFWLAHTLRAHIADFGDLPVRVLASVRSEVGILPFDIYLPMFVLVIPTSIWALENRGYYRRTILSGRFRTAWLLAQACFIATMGLIFVMFALKAPSARGVVILFSGTSFVTILVREELYRFWLGIRRASGSAKRDLLLLGLPADTHRLRRELMDRVAHDIRVIGEVDLRGIETEQFIELLHKKSPNAVVLATEHTNFAQAENVVQTCEVEGVEVWLMADFFKTSVSKTSFDQLFGRPVLVFHSAPGFSWRAVFKRAIDFSFSLTFLILFSIPLALVAAIIKITSRGPVLYRDERCGLNGRSFMMYKFRSMVWNARDLRAQVATMNEMGGPVFKATNDPRVTRFGAFIRKYSIDELPQFVNVLKGEMSLVGPRPLVVEEIQAFDLLSHRRRLSVRPGLTCLWQVNGRSNLRDFNDWMKMDLEYIDGWSLGLDFKILLRTIPTVLSGNGAR
jgi:exopolysaccharide biosynthesis polyprenyl glycosylphosphotransferase